MAMSSDDETPSDDRSETITCADPSSKSGKLSLDALPTELWMHVITFLSSKDLLQLALSNSRWKPFALEVKWTTGRVPLNSLLETADHDQNGYSTSRARRDRLVTLARAVTYLHINIYCGGAIILWLKPMLGLTPLCPAVRYIEVTADPPLHWDALVGSEVRRLTYFDPQAKIKSSTLKPLAEHCPNIECIRFDGIASANFPAVPLIYGGFRNLRILDHTMGISRPWWRALHESCPLLEGLRIDADRRKGRRVDGEWGSPLHWPTIEVFNLDGSGGPLVVEILLSDSTFPNLRTFGFSRALQHEAAVVFPRLAAGSPLLQNLHIRGDIELTHLHCFQVLRRIRFTKVSNVEAFKDSTLVALVSRLPKLQSLVIHQKKNSEGSIVRTFPITMTFLYDLARCCPDLRELEIPIDASSHFPTSASHKLMHLWKLALTPLVMRTENMAALTEGILDLCPVAVVFRVEIQPTLALGNGSTSLRARVKAWKDEVKEAPDMSRRMEALYFAKQVA